MRIIWAIDPFNAETRPDANGLAELRGWREVPGAYIVPVYVLKPETQDEGDRVTSRQWLKGAQIAVSHYLDSLGMGWVEDPVVLMDEAGTASSMVEELLRYAGAWNVDLMAVSTRGNSGISKLVLGSFAEALLRKSTVPLLFLSHRKHAPRVATTRVLFATDFSAASAAAFAAFLEYARQMRSKVILFHHVALAKEVSLAMAISGTVPVLPGGYLEEGEAFARKEAQAWIERARAKGVGAEIVIDGARVGSPDAILEMAESFETGLIAMSSQANAFDAFIFGSVARAVFRPHGIPVWICGPKFRPDPRGPAERQGETSTEAQQLS